jgi:sulfofructose kinase
MIERARAHGALIAVTAGSGPNELLLENGLTVELAVERLQRPLDDLGAGDVYASALFVFLAEGMAPTEAARRANAAAALRIAGVGPAAIATLEAIEERLGTVTPG